MTRLQDQGDTPVLTVPETAAALRISKRTVYRLIECGDLPATDVACSTSTRSKTRIERAAIYAFLRSRSRTA